MTGNCRIISSWAIIIAFLFVFLYLIPNKFTRSFPSLVLLLPRPRFLIPAFPFVLPPLPLPPLLVLHHDVRRRFPHDRFQRAPDFLQLRHGLAFPASSCLGWSSVSLRQPGTHQLPQRLCARLVRLNWRTSAEINRGAKSARWQLDSFPANGTGEMKQEVLCAYRVSWV